MSTRCSKLLHSNAQLGVNPLPRDLKPTVLPLHQLTLFTCTASRHQLATMLEAAEHIFVSKSKFSKLKNTQFTQNLHGHLSTHRAP